MNKIYLSTAILITLSMTGCGINTWYNPAPAAPSGNELSQKSPAYQEGYKAGCKTARGEYTKSSERFNNDNEYHDGWFAGRSSCQAQ